MYKKVQHHPLMEEESIKDSNTSISPKQLQMKYSMYSSWADPIMDGLTETSTVKSHHIATVRDLMPGTEGEQGVTIQHLTAMAKSLSVPMKNGRTTLSRAMTANLGEKDGSKQEIMKKMLSREMLEALWQVWGQAVACFPIHFLGAHVKWMTVALNPLCCLSSKKELRRNVYNYTQNINLLPGDLQL